MDDIGAVASLARAEMFRSEAMANLITTSVGDAEDLVVAVEQASQEVIGVIIGLIGRSRYIFSSNDVVEAMRQRDESVAALLRRRVDDANRALSVAEKLLRVQLRTRLRPLSEEIDSWPFGTRPRSNVMSHLRPAACSLALRHGSMRSI